MLTLNTLHAIGMKLAAALVVLTALLATVAPTHAQTADTTDYNPDTYMTPYEESIVDVLNVQRTLHGCQPLRKRYELAYAAYWHSVDMFERNFFSHVNPDGATIEDRVQDTGYEFEGILINENIQDAGYWNQSYTKTPEEVVHSWMESPGHRKTILTCAYEEVGVGHYVGDRLENGEMWERHFWTAVFATPAE